MNGSCHFACISLILLFTLCVGSILPFRGQEGGKDHIGLGDNIVPVTDDDLKQLTEVLRSASKSVDSCVPGSCFEVQCDDARALQDTLQATERALTKIQSALTKASELQLKKLEAVQDEAAEKAEDTHAREVALIWSKALNDAGKIYLAVASLADGFEELKKGFDAAENTTDFAEFYRQTLKFGDQCLEQLNEIATLCDDLSSSYEHISNIEHESFRPEVVVTAQRWKSNATDAYHVLFEFRKEFTKLMTAPDRIVAGKKVKFNLAEVKSNARASLKNVGLIIGRELADVAENGTTIPIIGKRLAGQKDLQNDIEENKKIMEALEPHHAEVYQQFLRIIYREEAIQKSLVLAQHVSKQGLACVRIFDCPNVGTTVLPDKPGMSFGDILKKYNPEIPNLTERLKSNTSKLAIKEGLKPVITVKTKKVDTGVDVLARYQVAICEETEGAQIQVRDTSSLSLVMANLGQAKRGTEESIHFKAPANVGDYELVIFVPNRMAGRVLRLGGRLASDSFSVFDSKKAVQQISLSGVWECKSLLTKPGSTYSALPLSMKSPPPTANGFVPVQLRIKQVKDSFNGETGPDKFLLKIHGVVSGTSFAADATYTFDDGEKASGVWKITILNANHFRVNPTFKGRPAESSINVECEFGRVR